MTTLKACPNCSADLETTYQFCPQCGQNAHIHRFNLPHIFHEIFHALTHADKGVLHLLKELAIRPGIVAREYVLEGKRKKYINPFTFLVLMLGITLFVNSIFHPYTRESSTQPTSATQSAEPAEVRQMRAKFMERRKNFQTFVEKRNNLVIFLAIPLFALVYWLFFLHSGINYAEHFVAQVFFSGFYSLLTLALLAPLKTYMTQPNQFAALQLLLQFLFLSFAYYQFMGPDRSWRLAKASLATLLALVVWVIFSFGAGYLYIRYGG
ncbi:DUF3667 domain-containing protein [Fibrisoma limi]|nr:DUF3667 domain-containing protein [Fibrisoma limi]